MNLFLELSDNISRPRLCLKPFFFCLRILCVPLLIQLSSVACFFSAATAVFFCKTVLPSDGYTKFTCLWSRFLGFKIFFLRQASLVIMFCHNQKWTTAPKLYKRKACIIVSKFIPQRNLTNCCQKVFIHERSNLLVFNPYYFFPILHLLLVLQK